ncbi:MAG: hypothetical protein WCQ64_13605 [Acidobacteriota bacterium]
MAIVVLLLSTAAFAQQQPKPKPCLILKTYQKKAADAFTRWTVPKPFNYVEGDFPDGLKFKSELGDKDVNEIKKRGGQVVILKSDYVLADLEDARKNCKAFQEIK